MSKNLLKLGSTILLATGNAHKAGEMRAILSPLLPESIRLVTLKDIGLSSPPDEIERFATFEANARAKAIWCAKESGLPSIADDSGLCVDALGGAPGVRSARWAGPDANDQDRCTKLLQELTKVGAMQMHQRMAKFVCACVLAMPNSRETLCRVGSVSGQILLKSEGENGFGYDPLFLIPRFGTSMASLGSDVKNQISHRGRALKSLGSYLAYSIERD